MYGVRFRGGLASESMGEDEYALGMYMYTNCCNNVTSCFGVRSWARRLTCWIYMYVEVKMSEGLLYQLEVLVKTYPALFYGIIVQQSAWGISGIMFEVQISCLVQGLCVHVRVMSAGVGLEKEGTLAYWVTHSVGVSLRVGPSSEACAIHLFTCKTEA